jgi:hypothetical protein
VVATEPASYSRCMQTLQPALFGLGFLCSQAKGEMMISCLWLFVYERWARSLHLYGAGQAQEKNPGEKSKGLVLESKNQRGLNLNEKAILQLDGQGR